MSSLEHVNLTVSDTARTARLINAVFGWEERWRGPSRDGGTTIHIGPDRQYLALYQPPAGVRATAFDKGRPFNHVGIEVEDLAATEARVVAAGLVPFSHDDYVPGRRFYFFDPDGIEFEIVSYAKS